MHGDYAPKNILLGPDGAWVLDAEVAHYGHPVFDLAFFLAFPLLTALQRPELAAFLQLLLTERFHDGLRAPPEETESSAHPRRRIAKYTGARCCSRAPTAAPRAAPFLSGSRRWGRGACLGQRLATLRPMDAASCRDTCLSAG